MVPVTDKLKGNRSSWYDHVKRRDEMHVNKRVINKYKRGWMESEREAKDGLCKKQYERKRS